MSEENKNKKNRVNLAGGNSTDSTNNQPIVDDFDSTPPKKGGGVGKIVYFFMFAIILILIGFLFKLYKQNQDYKSHLQTYKNELKQVKHQQEKASYGDLSIEVEPKDSEIYLNGELQKQGKGIKIGNADTKNRLIFEFKKPGYFPYKLEVCECNWKLKPGTKDSYFYEHRDVRLAEDKNEMMMIEQAEKEKKEQEEAEEKSKKKKKK